MTIMDDPLGLRYVVDPLQLWRPRTVYDGHKLGTVHNDRKLGVFPWAVDDLPRLPSHSIFGAFEGHFQS